MLDTWSNRPATFKESGKSEYVLTIPRDYLGSLMADKDERNEPSEAAGFLERFAEVAEQVASTPNTNGVSRFPTARRDRTVSDLQR